MTTHTNTAGIGTNAINPGQRAGEGSPHSPAPNTQAVQSSPATGTEEAGAGNADTHRAQILAHLKAGRTLTGIEALSRFGCFRLPARIYDLRLDGYAIERDMIETDNGARVARYRMGAV